MEKVKNFLPSKRRLIQLYSALLYNANIKGFISGKIYTGGSKILCVPGLNCYSCPGATGACPLGALQNSLASSAYRVPAYVFGILMLYGLILGRTICGFLCPMGLLQELLHKIPTPKLRKSKVTRFMTGLKYVLLAVFVVALPLWYGAKLIPLPAFCKYICPAGTLEGAVPLLSHPDNSFLLTVLGGLFSWKAALLVLAIVLCVFAYRGFCRFLCPLGAIYSLFSKINLVGVKLDVDKCVDCGKCHRVCGMDIHHVGDRECIHCGECIDSCPTNAITFRAGNIILRENETGFNPERKSKNKKASNIIWAAALVLLAVIIVLVHFQ